MFVSLMTHSSDRCECSDVNHPSGKKLVMITPTWLPIVLFSGQNENINSMNQSEKSLKSWGIKFSSNSMKFARLLWHSHCQAHCRVLRKLLHSWHLSVLWHVIPWLDVESPKVRWTGFRLNLYNFRHFGVVAEALENVILCPCLVSFCLRPKGTDDVKRWDEQQQSDNCWLDSFSAS